MLRKLQILSEHIFKNFITGKYGAPHIPTVKEIYSTISNISKDDYDPIFKNTSLVDVDIDQIRSSFNNVVDDITVLYDAIQDQSVDIMDQLTNSIKEYNGIKREIKVIGSAAEDIQKGKYGKDYAQYIFTENFTTLDNIDTSRINTIVDIKSKTLYIPDTFINSVDFSHYYNKKLDFRNYDYTGFIKEAGFVGLADAITVFDHLDPRKLIYRVQTNSFTPLKTSFLLKLKSDGSEMEINKVVIQLDQDSTRGHIRIQYKKDSEWFDFPGTLTEPVTSDRIIFNFEPTTTSYIKFDFIKEGPDLEDSYEYFIILHDINVCSVQTNRQMVLYSKSIKIPSYDTEKPVISTIEVSTDAIVPDGTSVEVYVARDQMVSGYFIDENKSYVFPNSLYAKSFVLDCSGLYPERHILLSDIFNNPEISGVDQHISPIEGDFDWIKIQSIKETDHLSPEKVLLHTAHKKDLFDNSVFLVGDIRTFGDSGYLETYGSYPQPDYPGGFDNLWFLEGKINENNKGIDDVWDGYLDGLTVSGLAYYASGVWDLPADTAHEAYAIASGAYVGASGYPFGFFDIKLNRIWRFGDTNKSYGGWWRPCVDAVRATEEELDIDPGSAADPYPDFCFNNIKFYKIYKFSENIVPIYPSLKLYMYETRPILSNYDKYQHNMIWRYVSSEVIKTTDFDTSRYNSITNQIQGPPQLNRVYIPLVSGQVLIENSIRDIRYLGHNNVLELDKDVLLKKETNYYLDLLPMSGVSSYISASHEFTFTYDSVNPSYLADANLFFSYSYKIEDPYRSYWEGYIICDANSSITIDQTYDKSVNKVVIQDIKNQVIYDEIFSTDNKTFSIDEGTYKLQVFCTSNPESTFTLNWHPFSDIFLHCRKNIKVVPKIEALRIVDFDLFIHSTPYENDNRCSIIKEVDGYYYAVVKEPNKLLIPGYYFNKYENKYLINSLYQIKNTGHYKRTFYGSGILGGEVFGKYITGSYGKEVFRKTATGGIEVDSEWNDGLIYPSTFNNYNSGVFYLFHSTYGKPIDLEDPVRNSGHLFYGTAENLPAFYSIEYDDVDETDKSLDRFLYKIDLKSDNNNTPILKSVSFKINEESNEI